MGLERKDCDREHILYKVERFISDTYRILACLRLHSIEKGQMHSFWHLQENVVLRICKIIEKKKQINR